MPQHSIRGSDVFIKADLAAIFDALDIAARHQPTGQFAAGWQAATNAMRTAIGIESAPEIVTVTERYERYDLIEVRHAYADSKRRQLSAANRRLLR